VAEPVLDVRGLRKHFGGLVATDDVSLDLRAGEIHALIGPNGAGKSTLVAQIAGTLAPEAGEVRIMGRDMTHASVAERTRAGLGRTFQITSVALDFSALRNVMLAVQGASGRSFRFLRDVRREAALVKPAMAELERFDLADRADVRASALSHGERRQLELAMAFALKPRLLLLDEPMAGLGAGGVAPLTVLLERLKAETPMLLIEHDMDAVFRLADRISVLAEGRIVFAGTPDEVRRSALVRALYLGAE